MSKYQTKSRPKTKSSSKTRSKTKPKHASRRGGYGGLIAVTVILLLIVCAYGGAGFYFSQHFLPGTVLNNSNVSFMTIPQAKEKLVDSSKSYKLTLVEQDFKKEVISGEDVGMTTTVSDSFDNMLDIQSGLEWGLNIFKNKNFVLEDGVITYNYDDDKLETTIDELECVDPQYPVEVKNAEIVLKDGVFAIAPESVGNVAHKDELIEKVKEAILAQKESIDLQKEGIYDMPEVYADDPELLAQKQLYDELNDVVITLKFGPINVPIGVKSFSGWIKADKQSDGSYKLSTKEDKVKEYVETLAGTYDTYNKPTTFTTHAGNIIDIATGDYGWKLNQEYAVQRLQELLLEKKSVTVDLTGGDDSRIDWWDRMAVGYDTTGKDDYGNTYAEVSIGEQHMWMYRYGEVIYESDVVTGNPNLGNDTPAGAFKIRYHQTNATLTGPGYVTQVAYWMVFADDVGFHDATWQPYFGGSLYLSNGSHGCVNLPLNKAAELYELVYDGMPVFVY